MKKIYTTLCLFSCFIGHHLMAQTNQEIALSLPGFSRVIKQNNHAPIKVQVTNNGKDFNKAVTINFSIDEEVISSKQLNLNLAHQMSNEITIDHQFALPTQEHQLKVWLEDSEISGSKVLSSISFDFLVARTTVPQLPLIEEFTSSTCAPCASFNSTFDPFLSSINANANGGQAAAVKYQMNWPSPGDDPSYNSEGNGRKNSYSVNSIPKSFLNGVLTSTFNQSVIDAAAGESAFNLVPYFYLSGDTVKATCEATSYTSMTSALRMYLALTEDFYTYTDGTTSQTTFHYVMRKMLPNYVGTIISNIHEDTTFTTNRTYKVTYGNVVQNSYNIWGTSAGFTLVAWIQDISTKEVFQAAFANTPSAQTIRENIQQNSLEVFPNPTEEQFTIKLELTANAQVSYTLSDLSGKIVQEPVVQELPAGKHILQTSTQTLPAGVYLCSVTANGEKFVQRIVVTK
jgi:hypothetical protein